MKRPLVGIGFVFASLSLAHADRRPPGDMINTDYNVEAPVLVEPVAGGGSSANTQEGLLAVTASLTVGEPFSGDSQVDPVFCQTPGQACTLEMGYDMFEFYSDRIPLSQLSVTLNNGGTFTNDPNVTFHIAFQDDLSGLKSGSVTDFQGNTTNLDLAAPNTLSLTLPNVEGQYPFDFTFSDRAGNITAPPIEKDITLDETPPVTESMTMEGGALFTSRSTVTLTIQCYDAGPFPSGVDKVRVATVPNPIENGRVFPFVEPQTSFDYFFGDNFDGVKTVVAQCGDNAGNWSVGTVVSSITRGNYQPNGFIEIVLSSDVVLAPDGVPETDQNAVSINLHWDPQSAGSLQTIHLTALNEQDLDVRNLQLTGLDPGVFIQIAQGDGNDEDGLKTITAVFEDAQGNLSDPATAYVRLQRTLPGTPVLAFQEVDISSITLSVYDPLQEDVTTFVFTPIQGIGQGADAAVVTVSSPSDVATFTDTDLLPNTSYSYTVQSRDLLHFSRQYVWTGRSTHAAVPSTVQPVAKEIFLIHVSWSANNNPPGTNYLLQYATQADFSDAKDDPSEWSSTLERDVTGLLTGTQYYFRVKAQNADLIDTDWSDSATTPTLSFDTPLPPTLFTADAVYSSSVSWEWTRAANNTEEGYQILNSTGGLVTTYNVTVSTGGFEYLETGLTPNTVQIRSIYAFNHLNSTFTKSAPLFATPEVITPPALPTQDHLIAQGSEITVFWGANGNPSYTQYKAQLSANSNFTDIDPDNTTDWITDTSFTFRGLRASTSYYARVSARGQLHGGSQIIVGPVTIGSIATETFDHNGELDLSNFSAFWKLIVPPGLISQDYGLGIQLDPSKFSTDAQDLVRLATEKSRAETNGLRFPIPGGLIQISATDTQGNAIDPPLNNQAQLVHLFGDLSSTTGSNLLAKGGGGGDGPGGRPTYPSFENPLDAQQPIQLSTLRIWVLDAETESWARLPGNSIDMSDAQLQGSLQKFGVFAVMGSPALDVDQTIAYPVPWRPHGPNAGLGAGQTGTEENGIRFTDIPQEGKITIYDLRGARVRELPLSGSIFVQWDGRNEGGIAAESGTYLWVVEADGHKKTGKLMVIR